MSNALAGARPPVTLAERFWSIARAREGTGVDGDSVDPVVVVRHVLAILDALDRGESAGPVSVRTFSFLKLLRESEQRGDLSYAAPEQISGDVLDERSLVFSVGVLLFERLTGRHPFGAEGNSVRRVARIRKGEFGSGINYFPTVPPGLRSILMKAMGPFPEERFANLADLRSHLDQFVDQEAPRAVRLPGTSSEATAAKPAKRRAPKSDGESTRIVDMSPQVHSELVKAAARASRRTVLASGTIEVTPKPEEAAPARAKAKPAPVARTKSAPVPRPVAAAPIPEPVPVALTPAPMAAAQMQPREAELMPELPRADYIPNLKPKAPRSLPPLLWAGLGAAVASVAFFMLTRSGGDHAATHAAAPAAKAAHAKAPAEKAAPAPTPAAAAQTEQAAPQPATPASFDPEKEGLRALAASRDCLTAVQLDDGVAFGIGLLYDAANARVRKVYFNGKDSVLPWKQRKCMEDKIIGSAMLAPPPKNMIVEYWARVRQSGTKVSFKLPQ